MRKGFPIYEEMRKYFKYEEAVSLYSEFPYIRVFFISMSFWGIPFSYYHIQTPPPPADSYGTTKKGNSTMRGSV
jgi:hypothetical protein